MRPRLLLWFCALLLLGSAPASAAPQRVVSVNLCADVLLLHLAERKQIASLTFLAATSPLSPVRERARGLPVNHGQLEEVLALQPDLVVAHRYGNTALAARLQRLGLPVLTLEPPTGLDAVATEIRRLAARLGRGEQAETLLARYARTLAPAPTAGPRPVLAVYGPNGITSGPGSLLHDVLTRSGFDNLAPRLGIGSVGSLRMEALLLQAPDALLFSDSGSHMNSLARQKLRHPALRQLAASRPTLRLPGRLWTCGGPEVLEAAQALALLRDTLGQQP